MIDAAEIKRVIDMEDVLAWYGLTPNRAGFVSCPFHPDKSPSLKIYKGSGGWHCFGCGAGSDIFDFVMNFEEVDFKDAYEIIVERAGLKEMESRQRNIKARSYARQFKKREKAKKEKEIAYWMKKVKDCEQIMRDAKEWTPELEDACKTLTYAEYRLEIAQGVNE